MVELLGLLLTGLAFFIPGALLSFGLFSGTKFNKLDRLLLGIVVSITLVPLLLFLEGLLLGLKLNSLLIFANLILLTAVAVGVLFYKAKHLFSVKYIGEVLNREAMAIEQKPLQILVPLFLVLILIAGFYLRIAYTWITNFFEFDPYYYTFITEMLVKIGSIPLATDISYFPLLKFHHEPAIVQYLAGSWYLVYNFFTGAAYSKDALILITNIYPPLVGALLSLLAFWFLRSQYNEVAGLAGALFFASTPQLLQKFAAGVAELQPWGVFSALLIFTAFALALRYKDWQFIGLAGLATMVAMLGAVQSMWPIGVMSAFFVLQAFANYYAGYNEKNIALISLVFSATVFISTLLSNLYTNAPLFAFPVGVLIGTVAFIPALVFFFLSKTAKLASYSRHVVIAAILVVAFLGSLLPVLPAGQSVSSVASGFIEVTSAFATYAGPLSRTIAEETPTDPGVLAGAFGILAPFLLLLLAVFLSIGALEILVLKKQEKLAAVFLVAAIAIVLFRGQIADFAIVFGQSTGLSILATLGKLVGTNEVFSFLIVSIAASFITFVHSEDADKNESGLLTTLIVYPVAYIGLNKVKFLLHLGFALVVAMGSFIGEIVNRARFIHLYFKVGDTLESPLKWTTGFAIVVVLLLGSVQVFGFAGKAPGAVPSVQALAGSQISGDWLAAMSWLRNNTNYNDPAIQQGCKVKFGHECRVISWWDYGHWTSFLGETKTVLDPGNSYEFLDQETAYGFVDNQSAFRQSMLVHNASHVLVDYELLDKWGALVFLSGTCQKTADDSNITRVPSCPDVRQIVDWKKGASQDVYEFDHYFERLSVNGQCPFAPGMLLLQGSFGLSYCLSQEQLVPIDRSGLRTDFSRKFQAVSLNSKIDQIDENVSYLIPLSQTSFISVNPDLSIAGRQSKAISSTYTRLYVFENLPGFKLVYRSPSGEVKIFERTFNTRGNSAVESQATLPQASMPLLVNANASNTGNEVQNLTNASQNVI